MELVHTFTVPVPPARAFAVLQDIERIGPCMPGAAIDSVDGRRFTGSVKVKLGPITVTYKGEAAYAEVDPEALTATIDARGKETRGSGTANATVTARLREVPEGSEVHVVTDLAITGKPAQFGRGVMEEVGQKLINQFAECLSTTLGEGEGEGEGEGAGAGAGAGGGGGAGEGEAAVAASTAAEGAPEDAAGAGTGADTGAGTPAGTAAGRIGGGAARAEGGGPARRADVEAIDLLDVAGAPVAKRLAPVLGLLLLVLLWRALRRR
jgi:carbon monoxide dehydrogenase subunit G